MMLRQYGDRGIMRNFVFAIMLLLSMLALSACGYYHNGPYHEGGPYHYNGGPRGPRGAAPQSYNAPMYAPAAGYGYRHGMHGGYGYMNHPIAQPQWR
jgi:hypothetical protein